MKDKELNLKSHPAIAGDWDDIRGELLTPEEIAETDLRVAVIAEIIKARQEKGISQKKLEQLSGVKQPVIARMETGTSSPQLRTLIKLLTPLGLTLKIVPITKKPRRLYK